MTAGEISRKSLSLVLSEPMLIVAELAWRWAFAAGAVGVLLFYSNTLRDAISLSATDQGALLSGNPLQVIDVGSRVIAGALPYLEQVALGALPKIAAIWLVCITLGRSPLIRKIVMLAQGQTTSMGRGFWSAMLAVHAVRMLLLLIVVSAYLGAGRVAATALGTDENHPRILAALGVYILVFSLGVTVYLLSNFIAALAPIFVAQGRGALDALAESVSISLRSKSLFGSTAASNATLRTFVATVITGATVLLLPLSRYVPRGILLAAAGVFSVIYCAASDVLLLARTMAYALITLAPKDSGGTGPESSLETPLYSAPPDLRS